MLARHYKDGRAVARVLVGKHANECGLFIDDDGPYNEREIIIVPLEEFLKAVKDDMDLLYQCAFAHLAWEAYQKYLAQRDVRRAAAREQERQKQGGLHATPLPLR